MSKALIWCEGPAPSSSFVISSTNHCPKLELFPGLAGAAFMSLLLLSVIEIPHGTAPIITDVYVIPFFPCTYFFFCRDCKLLRVQHCTYLPFVNDLDLLKTKMLLKSPMDLLLPYPLPSCGKWFRECG